MYIPLNIGTINKKARGNYWQIYEKEVNLKQS